MSSLFETAKLFIQLFDASASWTWSWTGEKSSVAQKQQVIIIMQGKQMLTKQHKSAKQDQ